MSIPAKDFDLPVILPGGYLVMFVFGLNLLLGGLLRIRKNPRTIGVVIAHFSMLFMLIAGAVSFSFKKDGNLALIEGQTGDEFQSFPQSRGRDRAGRSSAHGWQTQRHS